VQEQEYKKDITGKCKIHYEVIQNKHIKRCATVIKDSSDQRQRQKED
jgi:hypothetical protein